MEKMMVGINMVLDIDAGRLETSVSIHSALSDKRKDAIKEKAKEIERLIMDEICEPATTDAEKLLMEILKDRDPKELLDKLFDMMSREG